MRWEVLNSKGEKVPPLEFEGKTQFDVVREIIEAFDSYNKVFYISPTGTGKSLIALMTIWNRFSNGIIVVPTKHLQKQYYRDYNPISGKFRIPNLRINFILGRNNFICPLTGKPCNDPNLPCTQKLGEDETRYEVAAKCPYWNPRYPSHLANKVKYRIGREYETYITASGRWAIFYSGNPKDDCPYLRQYYESYLNSEVVVMNDKLWLIETLARRKPIWFGGIEIVDEVDLFLERLVRGYIIRYDRIKKYMDSKLKKEWDWVIQGRFVEREDVFELVFDLLSKLENRIGEEAETLYHKVNRIVDDFDMMVYKIDKKENKIYFFYKRPSQFINRLFRLSNRYFLGMSATLQDVQILKEYFGFKDDEFTIIYGKKKFPGKIYLLKTKRWWISHKNWKTIEPKVVKEVKSIIKKGVEKDFRVLVQAHAFKYVDKLGIPLDDAKHDYFDKWLKGEIKAIASTRTKRGVDLRKELIPRKLLIIPKFPLPDKESILPGEI